MQLITATSETKLHICVFVELGSNIVLHIIIILVHSSVSWQRLSTCDTYGWIFDINVHLIQSHIIKFRSLV